MAYMLKTTIKELTMLVDDMSLNNKLVFSTEDPEFLEAHDMPPFEYNMIGKTKLFFEKDYVVVIGRMCGRTTMAKDINILTNGNVENKEIRINAIEGFIKEYCEKHLSIKEDDDIYLVMNP